MTITVEHIDRVVLIRLNRPQALNALNHQMTDELIEMMQTLDNDPDVGCFVITGDDKAFAAGADIKEMAEKTYIDVFIENLHSKWQQFCQLRTPKIAAVSGYALGGGCELAMMCDMIFAAESAKFGQPEIKLGVIPGMGGSQRLTRLVGKSKAMDLILTGRLMGAAEAERAGLVARVIANQELLNQTLDTAKQIAAYSKPVAIVAKEAVEQALEGTLAQGLCFERRTYHALWATQDQKEGMRAFIEKRQPNFQGR